MAPWSGEVPVSRDFCFHSGPDSLDVLNMLGESPLTAEARRLITEQIKDTRQDASMRGENFITARVVFELCEREPLFMGGAFFFVVESGVAGEGDGGPQSKNRFDACAFWGAKVVSSTSVEADQLRVRESARGLRGVGGGRGAA